MNDENNIELEEYNSNNLDIPILKDSVSINPEDKNNKKDKVNEIDDIKIKENKISNITIEEEDYKSISLNKTLTILRLETTKGKIIEVDLKGMDYNSRKELSMALTRAGVDNSKIYDLSILIEKVFNDEEVSKKIIQEEIKENIKFSEDIESTKHDEKSNTKPSSNTHVSQPFMDLSDLG